MGWVGLAAVAAARVALLGTLLIFAYPRLLLAERPDWSRWDRLAASGMIGLLIVVGGAHLLVPLQLFEMLGLSLTLVGLVLVTRYLHGGANAVRAIVETPLFWLLESLDRFGDPSVYRSALARAAASVRHPPGLLNARTTLVSLLLVLAGLGVAGVAVWIRLADALTHAGPAPSDFLEHLQWAKWLTLPNFGLYPDWVYPRGMNALLAALRFLTQEEPHLVVRVGGPLLNLLTGAGLWYTVRTATGSRVGALVALGLWAGAPAWLPAGWDRQSAALPQEFSMAVLLPAAWWGYRYLERGEPLDRFLAGAAALVVAATHWITLIYLAVTWVGVGALTLAQGGLGKRTLKLAAWTAGGAVLGFLPQLIALALGTPILETVGTFGYGPAQELFQPVSPQFWVLLIGACAMAGVRRNRRLWLLPVVSAAYLVVHHLPLAGLQSPAVAARSWDYLSLAAVAAFGAGFAGLEGLVGSRIHQGWIAGTGVALVAISWAVSPPAVLRMEPELSHEYTLQVLRVRRELPPGSWMSVGRSELVALVLGAGQHVDADRFARFLPVPGAGESVAQALARSPFQARGTRPDQVPDLLFFVESNPFVSSVSTGSGQAVRIQRQSSDAAAWIQTYRQTHGEPEVFYRSPTMAVFRIPAPQR